MRKKYSICLDKNDILDDPIRYRVLNELKVGDSTISSTVAKICKCHLRTALKSLNILEEEDYLTSEYKVVKVGNSIAKCRVFTRIR